jgi:uncharacterized OsmC-like protein
MGSNEIARAIGQAREYLTANPAEARYQDGAATATIEDRLRVHVSGADGASMVTDMVAGIGGGGTAPGPGWMLRAAYASCVATMVAMRAAQDGFPVDGLSVTVDSESDDRGILGIDPSIPAGPLSMRVAVTMSGAGGDSPGLRRAIEEAVAHCPVHDAVIRAVPVEVVVEID